MISAFKEHGKIREYMYVPMYQIVFIFKFFVFRFEANEGMIIDLD
jgi:hypothetical protein